MQCQQSYNRDQSDACSGLPRSPSPFLVLDAAAAIEHAIEALGAHGEESVILAERQPPTQSSLRTRQSRTSVLKEREKHPAVSPRWSPKKHGKSSGTRRILRCERDDAIDHYSPPLCARAQFFHGDLPKPRIK